LLALKAAPFHSVPFGLTALTALCKRAPEKLRLARKKKTLFLSTNSTF